MEETGNIKEEELRTLIEGYDIKLVEYNSAFVKRGLNVRIVIYKKGGVGLKHCESIHKAIRPRLEIAYGEDIDINLEVTSPGINRVFKSPEEYIIFQGEPVALLRKSNGQWENGKLVACNLEDEIVTIEQNNENVQLSFNEIHKGKLEYTRDIS